MFRAYGDNPSSSKAVKKEEPEDEEEQHGSFSSFSIARAAREKAKREEQEKIRARQEGKKDKAAVRRFNLGDTSDEDDCTMVVVKSSDDDEDTKRIYSEQQRRKKEDEELEKRKRKNREKVYNVYGGSSRDRIKRSNSSDSDSYTRDRKRKRQSSSDSDSGYRREKKHNKSEKGRDRYIEPDKPKHTIKTNNWRFLATVGVRVELPDTYMMDERRPDTLLNQQDRTEPKQSSKYDQRFTAVLGAPYKINKLFFPGKTVNRSSRILDKPVTFREDPEWKFVRFPFNAGDDFELSTVRCDKQIDLAEEPTAERLAAREAMAKKHERIAIESDPKKRAENKEKMHADLKKESMEANAKLKDYPKDEDLWIQFLRLEAQTAKLEGREPSTTIERREAILKKALTNLPKSSKLLVEMMKLKKEKNVSIEEMNQEWKATMHRLPNSLVLWGHRLNEMKHDSKQFNRPDYISVVEQATGDLKGLLSGQIRSHIPERGTADFLIDLLLLRVRMELAMGYMERAVSIVQVLIEFNVFTPPAPMQDQFLVLNEVWEKNLPLVGEPNGKGWFHYRRDSDARPSSEWLNEIMEAADKYTNTELVELGRAAEKEDKMVIFARHERLHEKYYWRPVRAEVGNPQEEVERQVEFGELPLDFCYPLHLCLAVNLVKELGGLFYGKMLPSRENGNLMFDDPIGPRLFSFGLLNPSLHSVPDGLPQFIDRLLDQMAMDDPNPIRSWMQAINMSAARIRTRTWFMAQREAPFDMTAVLTELNDVSQQVVNKWLTRKEDKHCDIGAFAYVLSIYEAINLFQAHCDGMNPKTLDKSLKKIVKSIVTKALIWSSGKPVDSISRGFNKSVVLVLATLLVRLPGSWDERKHRVQCVLLGKDGKTDEFPLADQVKAKKMVEDIMKGDAENQSDPLHRWLSVFFGFDFVLASVIEALLTIANAAKTSVAAMNKALAVIKSIIGEIYEKTFDKFDHYEQWWMYYVQILKYGKNDLRQVYLKVLEPDTHHLLNNTLLVREYIDSQQSVINEVKLLADLKRNAEDEGSLLFHSLARLYAHRKQFTRIVASAEMQSDLTVATRVVKVYIDEAKRQKDPVLWRYALNLAAQFKKRKLGDEVFTQAFADCSWSRDLHLDYIEAFPDEDGASQQLLLTEKHIRIRGDPALVQTYIDHAKKVDGRE